MLSNSPLSYHCLVKNCMNEILDSPHTFWICLFCNQQQASNKWRKWRRIRRACTGDNWGLVMLCTPSYKGSNIRCECHVKVWFTPVLRSTLLTSASDSGTRRWTCSIGVLSPDSRLLDVALQWEQNCHFHNRLSRIPQHNGLTTTV